METAIFLFSNPIIVLARLPASLIICVCLNVSNIKSTGAREERDLRKYLILSKKIKM